MLTAVTEEQDLLRASVRAFAASRRDKQDGRRLEGDPKTWTAFAEQGWIAAGVPECAGGLGAGVAAWAIIAEELGRTLVQEAFPSSAAAASLLAQLAPGGALLGEVMSGGRRVVLAHGESEARGEALWVATEANANGRSFRVSGTKSAILGGPGADVLLVTATHGRSGGLGVFAIDAPPASANRVDYRTVDNRGASNIVFDNFETPRESLLSAEVDASQCIERANDVALVLSSAEALGAMEAAFEMTRSYLMSRRQFGQPIGDFQALRHRIADMYIELEQARSIVMRATAALADEKPGERQRLASAAKVRVAQAGKFITSQAIQLHGAIGVTEEFSVGHYFKRLTMFAVLNGSEAAHIERFARLSPDEG